MQEERQRNKERDCEMDSGMSGTADIAAEKLLEAEMSADQGSTEQVIELNVSCMRSLCSPVNHSLVFHVMIVLYCRKTQCST